MAQLDARKAGSFKINGDIEIHRLGFGAMRITGPRVWGPRLTWQRQSEPSNVSRSWSIDFIDTANSYGPRSPSG